MPTVDHPRALDSVPGHLPDSVSVGGDSYPVSDDGTVDLPTEADVRTLAAAYDLDTEALQSAGTCDEIKSDGDVCGRGLPCPYHSDGDEEESE